MADKLSQDLSQSVFKKNITNTGFDSVELFFGSQSNKEQWDGYNKDYKKINQMDATKQLSKKQLNQVSEFVKKYNLSEPVIAGHNFGGEGLIAIQVTAEIRGNLKYMTSYFPIKSESDYTEKIGSITDYTKYFTAALDDYSIKVGNVAIYWIPANVTILVLYSTNIGISSKLQECVRNRDYYNAVKNAETILTINSRFDIFKRQLWATIEDINNSAFCYINVDDISKAKKSLNQIKDKHLISNINLAYIYSVQKRYGDAKRLYKKIKNKTTNTEEEALFLHLCIFHDNILHEHKIIEDISFYNCCCWNLILITAFTNDIPAYESFKKLPKPRNENEVLIQKRVLYWVNYYKGDVNVALNQAKVIFRDLDKEIYMYKDIEYDIKVFQLELE